MTDWQELVDNDLGGFVSHCNRIDHQWIINQLKRDGFWVDYRENEIRQRYEEWCEIHTLQQYWTSFEDWCLDIIGTDWETNYFWDFKQHLVNVILPRLSFRLELHIPRSQRDQGFTVVDLLHRLSDRLLTAVIYCCFSNSHWANFVENNPPPLTGQSSDANFSALFERIRYAALNTDGDGTVVLNFPDHEFDDTIVGCPIEFEGGSAEVGHSLAFIQSVDGHDVTLDTTIPTSTGLTVNIFFHPKHENAKSLVEGFADSYDSVNMKQRLNCLQHAAIYVNESEFDLHTILWDQLRPVQIRLDPGETGPERFHCDIYELDFSVDADEPIATQATVTIAGTDYTYTTKMIALHHQYMSQVPELEPPETINTVEEASLLIRLSKAIHSPSGLSEITADDGVNYTFTWTQYFGFTWIPSDQLEFVNALVKPMHFLPPKPHDYTIRVSNPLVVTQTSGWTGNDLVDYGGDIGNGPSAITWHWSVTDDMQGLETALGPTNNAEKSATYGVGRRFGKLNGNDEGSVRWVAYDRSTWHAGPHYSRTVHGAPTVNGHDRANRNAPGIETVNTGYASLQAAQNYVQEQENYRGSNIMAIDGQVGPIVYVPEWSLEQVVMMIDLVVNDILVQWPGLILPRHHHGHHDVCPTNTSGAVGARYKIDSLGFPFARVLRGIYPNIIVPDVWSEFWDGDAKSPALEYFGYPEEEKEYATFGGGQTHDVLEEFKTHRNTITGRPRQLKVDPVWCTFTNWEIHDARVSDWVMPND